MNNAPNPLEASSQIPLKPVTLGLEGATVRYGDHTVLDNVSVMFDKPEIAVILGSNGAGKSTFLSACAGLLPLSSGRAFRQEADGTPVPITRLGYVLQKPVMFRRSVMDNIMMATRALPLHDAGLARRRDALLSLLGLQHLIHKPVHHLSIGERQRLVVARVLITQPGILMCDEATNSLDTASVDIMEAQIRDCADQGLPVLWVTHSMDQARRLADRVIRIEDGRITYDGPAAAFFAKTRP